MTLQSKLRSWDVHNEPVFLRADLNVSLKDEEIIGTCRLKGILPTLDFLLNQNATVFLATHIGRPQKKDAALSTRLLMPWFKEQGYNPLFIEDILSTSYPPLSKNSRAFYLLENLRFYPEESSQHCSQTEKKLFAQKLALHARWYVNDAFSACHRDDTSLTLLATEFDFKHRTIGFLTEKEIISLETIKKHHVAPFAFILGGCKFIDKLLLIDALLDQIDRLLLCPAIVHAFLKAKNQPIGKSLIDEHAVQLAKTILKKAEQKIVWPIDYLITKKETPDVYHTVKADDITESDTIISIGTQTVILFDAVLDDAKMVAMNGVSGFNEKPKTMSEMDALFAVLSKKNLVRLIFGGDTVTALVNSGYAGSFEHLSLGGGATLAFLSNNNLPGLKPFINH